MFLVWMETSARRCTTPSGSNFPFTLGTLIETFSCIVHYNNYNVLYHIFSFWCVIGIKIKLMKGKALRKHSLHEKIAASVLLKLFINSTCIYLHKLAFIIHTFTIDTCQMFRVLYNKMYNDKFNV